MSPSEDIQARLGDALVDFAENGTFPDEEATAAANLESSGLEIALQALMSARMSLEDEIRTISGQEAPNVDSWIEHASALQQDIEKSVRLANRIVRQAEADDEKLEEQQEEEGHVAFLEKEYAFSCQLQEALQSIESVHESLEKAEELLDERRILEPLQLLEKAWSTIEKIPADRSAQAVRLLDTRCFDLRTSAHDLLKNIWESRIVVNYDERTITINSQLQGEADMDDVLVAMRAYKEVEKTARQFWDDLNNVILKPRIDLSQMYLRSIQVQGNTISVGDEYVDRAIKALFNTIEDLIQFLIHNLPTDFTKYLAEAMMPSLSARIKENWLDTAVPASLDDMVEYQKSMALVHEFAEKLESLQWPGTDCFNDWVTNAPKIWLNKRRETSLDWTRNQLALGVGNPQPAEHVERQMVSRDEGMQISSTGNMVTQDWDAAWDSDEEDHDLLPPGTNRASVEEHRRATQVFSLDLAPAITPDKDDDDEDAANAWGWGDEDATDGDPLSEDIVEPLPPSRPTPERRITPETREITLSEPYKTSSLPQPVFKTITTIFNDAARMTSQEFEHVPITTAAPGLFNLPSLVLATYRAVSPYYYGQHPNGNMFTYNDSIWLCDQLKDFASKWEERGDLSPRTYGKVKLDQDIRNLESFGKRAYTNELTSQRTVITDLLGGTQNFFQQDGTIKGELQETINSVVEHIRMKAASWNEILPYSAWASSVGSLVNTIANKIITDVFDLGDVSVDEAESIATLISDIIKLDDLFTHPPESTSETSQTQTQTQAPENGDNEPIPMTAQFADRWMKLKFLCEVLQSNLKDIKFFWFDSDLSLYFTADEVIDLINLSFENNASVRQAIREIKERPDPMGSVGH